mgnify:FL=1
MAGYKANHHTEPCCEGFTLVEVVVTTAILSGVFVALIGGFINISEMNSICEDRTQATAQLANTLEALRGLPIEKLLTYEPANMSDLGATASVSLVCITGEGGSEALPTNDTKIVERLPDPFEVRVTVLWRDARGRPQAQTASAIYRR